jgi:hypothetical protein
VLGKLLMDEMGMVRKVKVPSDDEWRTEQWTAGVNGSSQAVDTITRIGTGVAQGGVGNIDRGDVPGAEIRQEELELGVIRAMSQVGEMKPMVVEESLVGKDHEAATAGDDMARRR